MLCNYFYPRDGRCAHTIYTGDRLNLCSVSTQFLCTLGEKEIFKPKGGVMHLSHSSREVFIRCRRAFFLQRIKHIKIRDKMLPLPVKLGMIWDKYMESTYLGIKFMEEFWRLVDTYDLDDMETAKMYGLISAHRKIGMQPQLETSDGGIFQGCQHKFEITDIGDFPVIGFIDRVHTNHITEIKLSARPDFYFQVHNISSQIGTYFLSNPKYEYAIIEAVRVPGLRTGAGKYSDESPEAYRDRISSDIISRPSYYFLGYDRGSKTFGKKFYRNEFDMEELVQDYKYVNQEIMRAVEDGDDAFYKNRKACYVPGQCFYLPICDTGCVSESIFEVEDGAGASITNEEVEEVENE